MISLTYLELMTMKPCNDRLRAVKRKLGGPIKWGKRKITAAEAVDAGVTLNDMLWVVHQMAYRDQDVARRARLFAADCAAHVLHIYETAVPGDDRPRKAIEIAMAYARGRATAKELKTAGAAARAAAGAAAGATARAAARAAEGAAARAAARAAEEDAVRDAARAAAGAAARAAEGADAWAAERKWQLSRLVARLSDDEPEDWPLDQEKAE